MKSLTWNQEAFPTLILSHLRVLVYALYLSFWKFSSAIFYLQSYFQHLSSAFWILTYNILNQPKDAQILFQ